MIYYCRDGVANNEDVDRLSQCHCISGQAIDKAVEEVLEEGVNENIAKSASCASKKNAVLHLTPSFFRTFRQFFGFGGKSRPDLPH